MDFSRIVERLGYGFHSTTEKVMFLVVVGGALAFVCYLLVDALYHKLKWRRLNRKFQEAGSRYEEQRR